MQAVPHEGDAEPVTIEGEKIADAEGFLDRFIDHIRVISLRNAAWFDSCAIIILSA